MHIHRVAFLSVGLAACGGGSTDVGPSLLEYRGPIAGTFAEVFSYTSNTGGGPAQCTVYSTLTGTVRVKLKKQGELTGADAGVDITERVVGASQGCGSSREVRPYGEWTASVQGSASQLGFSITRTSSNQTTTINFDGSFTNNVILGTLKYSRTSSSIGGPTAGTSTGTSEFPISIQVSPSQSSALTGTWSGTLTFTLAGATAIRATTLVLAQNGAAVTGQLQFSGGEVGTVDGTVSGSTLAITVTPRPNSDNCERYSFGITFVTEPSQLKATGATGTGCEVGGQILRQFSAASGVLIRS